MKVIHFCSYYTTSKVYELFFAQLVHLGIEQTVFFPRRHGVKELPFSYSNELVDMVSIRVFSLLTRISLLLKIFMSLCTALICFRGKKYAVIHAHTLYSDGLAAYFFSLLKGGKLIVSLRNTDVNLGFKCFPHYKWLVRKVLARADKIVFISPGHKTIFESRFGREFSSKTLVIPNGISDQFTEGALLKRNRSNASGHAGLYVGKIDKNKNLAASLAAFFSSKVPEDKIFYIVGGSRREYELCYGKIPTEFVGRVRFVSRCEQVELKEYYDLADVFVMPSFYETFGLVYIEAISRCIPIVYTRGQGVSGYFEDGLYGFECDAKSIDSIRVAIENCDAYHHKGLGPFLRNPAKEFGWPSIAKLYVQSIYNFPDN